MRIIHTDAVSPDDIKTQAERDWVYNGMDCCVTAEVLDALLPQLDEHTSTTYNFSRSLQGPALEMRLHGVRIDQRRKAEVIDLLIDKREVLERNLERIVLEGIGLPHFNYRSKPDVQKVFYERLQIPKVLYQGRVTVRRNAIERFRNYQIARPIANHLLALGDIESQLKMLKTAIDPDGRIRTSYNIAGTNTGRFSSSYSEFGTGGNLQNIEEELRSIFVADKGMKLAKFDAKSGESFCVGAKEWNLFNDGRYLDACEEGDPHTATARICWPDLGWTGDLSKDKALAETPYYRHHTYRFMCKKLGHGSNYNGQEKTLAEEAQVPVTVVADFQPRYFKAFPAHRHWHRWVEDQLLTAGHLITLTGRKRWFFGRRNDAKTLREAIAYDPQGSLADIVNQAMLRIWRYRDVELYMHDHDALTVQYPEEKEDEVIPQLLKLLEGPISLAKDRTLLIPYDCVTGWNRGKYDAKTNPDGLKDYTSSDSRRRTEETSILDRRLR